MTKVQDKEAMLAKLQNFSNSDAKKTPAPVVQEIRKPLKKSGRPKHRIDGVDYVRLSPAIPRELKSEMDVAMRTTHKDYPTIDAFVEEAVKMLLSIKK